MMESDRPLQSGVLPPMIIQEEINGFDRHAHLRPWRYFRFYMLYEPRSKRVAWLPEGYDK